MRFARRSFFAPVLGLVGLPVVAALATGCSQKAAVPDDVVQFDAFRNPSEAPAALQKAAEAVVRIETLSAYGSGSFVSADGVLMTNNHVVGSENCSREGCWITIRFNHERGKKSEAKHVYVEALRIDPGLDVTFWQTYETDADDNKAGKLATPSFVKLTTATNEELVGQRVHIIGHPHGHLKKWSTGNVVSFAGAWFTATAYVLAGNSGSPVLNDDGDVVGIIHRGSNDGSLITRDALNAETICSPAALIQGALAAGSPAESNVSTLLRSTKTDVTAGFAQSFQELYRASKVGKAVVGGVETSIYDLLVASCDQGLANTVFDTLEDVIGSYSACSTALSWIDCSEKPAPYLTCPDAAGQAAWQARFKAIYDRRLAWNGSAPLSWITSAPTMFEKSADMQAQETKASFDAWLASTKPALTFDLASSILFYGETSYAGQDLTPYILQYQAQPSYELSISSILSGVQSLYFSKVIDAVQFRGMTRILFDDPKISLGDKLYVEEVGYVRGILP